MILRWLLLMGFLAGCAARQDTASQAPQNPSPMVEHTRAHERIEEREPPGLRFAIEDLLDKPVEVYLPAAHEAAPSARLLIHFHGASYVAEHAVHTASEAYVLAVVNLGSGSSVYERAFADPATLPRLIAAIAEGLEQRLDHPPEIAQPYLSAFSAGYGAVRALLRAEPTVASLDGVILLDGLHTDYVPARIPLAEGGRLETNKLDPFLKLARAAMQGNKRFLISHSEIFPGTYASTTETADYLIESLGLKKTPVLQWGPGGMQQLSEVRQDRFLVLGFAGNTAPDHVDHLHALPHFLETLSNGARHY